MKKKIRVCKWLVIGITSIGVIIMAVGELSALTWGDMVQ